MFIDKIKKNNKRYERTMLVVVIIALVVIAATLASMRFSYATRLIEKIPGPKGWPIVGNMFDGIMMSSDDLFKYPRQTYKEYGKISKLYAFNVRFLNIYDPADIETILSTTRFNDKQYPYTFIREWLCEGLLTSNGDKWHNRRKLLTPAFHFNVLRRYTTSFNEQTEELLKRIQKQVDADEDCDLVDLITPTTLNIMTETLMDITVKDESHSDSKNYYKTIPTLIQQCIIYRMLRLWLFFDWLYKFTKTAKIEAQALKVLHGYTNKIIQERKIYREKHKVISFDDSQVYGKRGRLALLDLLLENQKEGKIDDSGIREEVDTFMFEGHDTTAMILIFMIMRIANEPQIQESIYTEMKRIFGDLDRLPTIEDLKDMKYLEMCIKEALRIYPSVPYITRYLKHDTVLSGYKVPSGTVCHIHMFDVHRRSDLYPDPEKFIPERFLPENIATRHPYSYIPFSAGPRNCIGQKFAMLELKTVMSGILRRYRLEAVTRAEDIVFTAHVVLRTNHPIYVRFLNRAASD